MSNTATQNDNADTSAVDVSDQNQSGTTIFTGTLHRVRRGNNHAFASGERPAPYPTIRKPGRLARMLAFAHALKRSIDRVEYEDQAAAARSLGITRARVSQLLDLTLLAPDIQEEILFLERVDGVEPITERGIREVVKCEDWGEQRKVWHRKCAWFLELADIA